MLGRLHGCLTRTQGVVTAVWYDEEEKDFVVQHKVVHLSFYEPNFVAFVDALLEAKSRFGKKARSESRQ